MTDFRTMYDSDYIGHFDLPEGEDLTVTIKRVNAGELTAIGGRKSKKPIVHFDGEYKPLICNKTNGKTIASLYGNAVEGWRGKRITLFVSSTRDPNGGGETACIRIRPKVPAAAKEQQADNRPRITDEQALQLSAMCAENDIPEQWLCTKAKVTAISQIAAEDFDRAVAAMKAKIEAGLLATQA